MIKKSTSQIDVTNNENESTRKAFEAFKLQEKAAKERMQEQINALKSEIDSKNDQLIQMEYKLKETEKNNILLDYKVQYEQTKEKVSKLEEENENLTSQINKFAKQKENIKNLLEKEQNDLKNKLKELEEDIAREKNQSQDLQKELSQYKVKCFDLESKLQKANSQPIPELKITPPSDSNQFAKENQKLKEDIEELTNTLDTKEELIIRLKNDIENLKLKIPSQ